MKALAIGSHPDDIEIGCSGTLLQLIERGWGVHHLLMTEGGAEVGFDGRTEEQKMASKDMGVKTVRRAKMMDTQIDLRDAIRVIEESLDEINPDYVFTHWNSDTNQDHRTIFSATLSACRHRGNILFYETLSTEQFFPPILFDITDQIDKKIDLVKMHVSQEKRLRLEHWIKTVATYRALKSEFRFVEGFTPRRLGISL